MSRPATWLGASASAFGLLAATGALAQSTISTPAPSAGAVNGPPPPAASTEASSPATSVQEIVVTGERRTTNLQTTPIAATVLDQTT